MATEGVGSPVSSVSQDKLPGRPLIPAWCATAGIILLAFGVTLSGWVLIDQNRQLKAALQGAVPGGARVTGYAPGDSLAEAGEVLVSLSGGEPTRLSSILGDEGGVLALLTVTCQYCRQTLPVWEEIATELEKSSVRFVGLSFNEADATSEYRERHGIRWPLWDLDSRQDLGQFRINGVPVTLLLNRDGRIEEVWNGALVSADATTIVEAATRVLRVGEREADAG